ncbi:uncharacterized protein LOC135121428 isoform X2 [Zophobas morio]|uniref:uncharacterized protein LOC135121428 isoform X2 n=1 Tax=Zophobas morio TaxID=2755281 RepID=UPI003083307B
MGSLWTRVPRDVSPLPTVAPLPPQFTCLAIRNVYELVVIRCLCNINRSCGGLLDFYSLCLVWQHISCMKCATPVPTVDFYCERCVPRRFTYPANNEEHFRCIKFGVLSTVEAK